MSGRAAAIYLLAVLYWFYIGSYFAELSFRPATAGHNLWQVADGALNFNIVAFGFMSTSFHCPLSTFQQGTQSVSTARLCPCGCNTENLWRNWIRKLQRFVGNFNKVRLCARVIYWQIADNLILCQYLKQCRTHTHTHTKGHTHAHHIDEYINNNISEVRTAKPWSDQRQTIFGHSQSK